MLPLRTGGLNMTSLRYFTIAVDDNYRIREGSLQGSSVYLACYDLVKLLEKEEPSFTIAKKALNHVTLKVDQYHLALAWMLHGYIEQNPKLQHHLPTVITSIRDFTTPNIPNHLLTTIAEHMVKAGESRKFLQYFLLPKLKHSVESRYGRTWSKTLSKNFETLHDGAKWPVDLGELLQCFVYVLRAEGDIPNAISAATALNHFEPYDYDAAMDLLSLHIAGIDSDRFLPKLLPATPGVQSDLRNAFHAAASQIRDRFSAEKDLYDHDVYYLHSLFLLDQFDDLISECNLLIEKKPQHKERFLPWLFSAQSWNNQTVLNHRFAPLTPSEGTLPPRTAILEATMISRLYLRHGLARTAQGFTQSIVNLAQHTLKLNQTRYTATNQPTVRTTPALRPLAGLDAIESAFVPFTPSPTLLGPFELLPESAHSRIITSTMAWYFATKACLLRDEELAEGQSIAIYRKIWPHLTPVETHYFGRACEVIGDYRKALDSYMLSGGDEIGNLSRIHRSIVLAKMGLYNEAITLYNKICDERDSYDKNHFDEFEVEWGLFFCGKPFSYSDSPAVPEHLIDLDKAAIHLRRVIDARRISSDAIHRIYGALGTCYEAIGKKDGVTRIMPLGPPKEEFPYGDEDLEDIDDLYELVFGPDTELPQVVADSDALLPKM